MFMIRFSSIPLYSNLSNDEKQKLKDLVILIENKSNQARREGILALEDSIDDIDDEFLFLAEMFRYVVDGNDEEYISALAINLISTTECSDFEKLKMQIATNGALGIQEGLNPRNLTRMLLSMFGSEAYFELKKELMKD